jgi:hypothetical protein
MILPHSLMVMCKLHDYDYREYIELQRNQLGLLFGKLGLSPQMKIISLVLCLTLILIYMKKHNTMIDYKE